MKTGAHRGRGKGAEHVLLDLSACFRQQGRALCRRLDEYVGHALSRVPPGATVTLTGPAPVWLYLKIAHALHGRARALYYESPVMNQLEIFNHDPE